MASSASRAGWRQAVIPTLLSVAACTQPTPDGPKHTDPVRVTEDPTNAYLVVAVSGQGTVTSNESPPKINCGEECFGRYTQGQQVSLRAQPAPGWIFSRFDGDDTCITGQVQLTYEHRCIAMFVPENDEKAHLTVRVKGEGSVIFESIGTKPGCEDECARGFDPESEVELGYLGRPGWTFIRWEGHPDCADGRVTMDRAKTCVAVFGLDPTQLKHAQIEIVGPGRVGVGAVPAVDDCERTCLRSFFEGSTVILDPEANRERDAIFLGWSGDPSCAENQLVMDSDKSCTAHFGESRTLLNLYVSAGGTVRVEPGTAVCQPHLDPVDDTPCAIPLAQGVTATLIPEPEPGFELHAFGGDCTSQRIEMKGDATCRVAFRPIGPSCDGRRDAQPPTAPGQIRANARGCNEVSVSWSRSTDGNGCGVRSYELFRGDQRLALLTDERSSFLDRDWTRQNTRYRYKVRAIDAAGNVSNFSDIAETQTPSCPAIPSRIDTAVILVKFPELARDPFTKADADNQILTGRRSLARYMEENSHGATTMEGEVFGWYVMPNGAETYCNAFTQEDGGVGCDLFQIHADVARLVDDDIDFSLVERVILVLNDMSDFAGAAGGVFHTEEGSIAPMVTISARSGFILSTLAHELGHTYRALHAARWNCINGPVGTDHRDPLRGGCIVWTYGDHVDSMGGGAGHFSAFHKERLGILPASRIAVAGNDGTYDIGAIELDVDAAHHLKVPLSVDGDVSGDYYSLEYRRPVGFDTIARQGEQIEGVVIRLAVGYPTTASADTVMPEHGWLITPGSPFYDPNTGIIVHAVALGEERATVLVDGLARTP